MQEINEKAAVDWWNSADEYFKDFCWGFSSPKVIKSLGLMRGDRVLEIGYGYGREMIAFLNITEDVYGIDVRNDNEHLAKRKLKEMGARSTPKLTSYNGYDLPYEDEFFDLIYSCFTIQHMSKVIAKKLIASCLRKIKKGGTVLHEFYGHPKYLLGPEADAYSGRPNLGGIYNNAYEPVEIKALVESVGGVAEEIVVWPVGETNISFNNYWVKIRRPK